MKEYGVVAGWIAGGLLAACLLTGCGGNKSVKSNIRIQESEKTNESGYEYGYSGVGNSYSTGNGGSYSSGPTSEVEYGAQTTTPATLATPATQSSTYVPSSRSYSALDEAYNDGYEEGYSQGYEDGSLGLHNGHNLDEASDYEGRYEEKYIEGYEDGYSDGWEDGHNDRRED